MEKKKKFALFLGILLFSSGFRYRLNGQKSEEFANHILSYTEMMDDDNYDIAAHRGFSSLAVENTSDALSLAASKNYIDTIEVDARLTGDNQLVLSHNDSLYISMNETKDISTMTYDDALEQPFIYSYFRPQFSIFPSAEVSFQSDRCANLFGKEYHICGLEEGLQSCGDKKILLDLKFNHNVEDFVEELLKELEGKDTSSILFQSLDLDGIRYLKEHSDFRCLFLVDSKQDLSYIDEFDGVGINYRYLDKNLVKQLLDDGKIVAVWTINRIRELDQVEEALGECPEDIIYITNYPDMIATELRDRQLTK